MSKIQHVKIKKPLTLITSYSLLLTDVTEIIIVPGVGITYKMGDGRTHTERKTVYSIIK